MKWKKVVDNPDLKIFESEEGSKKKIIEARLEGKNWHIIKKEDNDVLEYRINEKDIDDMLRIIFNEKNSKVQKKMKDLNIKLYRTFKDNLSEKWIISLNNETYSNFAFVHMNDIISVDVILHIKYKLFETKILNELKITLGLQEDDTEYNIYYYTFNNKYFDLQELDYEEEWDDEN